MNLKKMRKLFFGLIALALFFTADMSVNACEEVSNVRLEEAGDAAQLPIAKSTRNVTVPEDTGALPGADPDYVFDQDKRVENGKIVTLGDIEVVYEDGTPVEDGMIFNLFNMTVMKNESVLYTTKDGKLSGIEMIAGKEYKLGFDVTNEFWHSHEVVGAYNSKKLIRLYARYEGQAPLYYDYFEGIDGEELAVPKIVIRKLGDDETAVQTRPTSCITSLIIADNGYYADAGAPFRIVCKDNGKGKTVISDEGALTFTADANLHYEIVLADNPTYKMKEKVEFIIQMDSRGIYWMIYEGGDIENAADRLTYIEVERIDGKTDAYEGKTPIGDTDCGGTEDGSGSECTPQEYAFIYDDEKVTLSGMPVYKAFEGTTYHENAVPLEKPIKFVFYNCSRQEFEGAVVSENGMLPDVQLYKNHSYIVYFEDSEYMAPNYYIKLSESGEKPVCTKCYGKEDGFYLYERKTTVEDPARANRVPITLPVQIKQGMDMVLKPGIKVKLVSPYETVEAVSNAEGYISVELIEDINYVVVVEDDEYSAESFPMTIKDKSEYGAGKYPYDHTSCGGVNGIYLCEKGTEHDNDTTLVCPSGKTTVTGMNFRGGRYVLQGRILSDVKVNELKDKKYDVLDVDVINMYRTELSKLATGEFTITRTLEKGRTVSAVYYIDANGELQEVEFSQNGNKLTYKMSSLSMYNNVIEYKDVKVTKITITGPAKWIAAGKKVQLTAKVTPSNADNKKVTWKSSNTNVATVNSNGLVTVKKNTGGKKVTITATATDGSKVKGTYEITSMKGIVKKIELSGAKVVQAKKSITLIAKVTATAGANKNLAWSSSNTKYVTVSAKGVVTAKEAGIGKTVTITAKAKDGSGVKATYKVKILKGIVKSIKITGNLNVKAGQSTQLKAIVTATEGANKKVTWTSSNKRYATVSATGKVTTYKAGKGKTVKITAKATDGSGVEKTVIIKIK